MMCAIFFFKKTACLPLPLSSFHGLEPECYSDEPTLAIQKRALPWGMAEQQYGKNFGHG